MDSNEQLRQRVLRLIKHGVSHKVLAAKMGMEASTFSRWLNRKPGSNPASVLALDGFNAYVRELQLSLTDEPSEDRRQRLKGPGQKKGSSMDRQT